LSNVTQTSLGPNGMNKLIINHIDKHYVTSDAATMLAELEVAHPAAKLLVMASQMQEQEYGDGTNFVIVFAGELLRHSEEFLKQGLHSADIISGYECALEQALKYLSDCVCWSVKDVRSEAELSKAIGPVIASKKLGVESLLSKLVAQAAVCVMPPNAKDFSVDSIRVSKLSGGSLSQSHLVNGIVINREPAGTVSSKTNCNVVVFSCGLEVSGTEAKGTVLLNTAEELTNFTKGEEDQMEELMKGIKNAGVNAIVVGGSISDIGQHFANKYDILTIKLTSKFELRRLCKTLGAVALVRMGVPIPEEIGKAESISVEEISSKKVTVVKAKGSKVVTIVLRAATPSVLDEVERSIDDAVNCIKSIVRDPRFVPGAGASDIEVAHQLQVFGSGVSGLDQLAILKYAESFECVVRILAENSGHDATEVKTNLYSLHAKGKKNFGVDVESGGVVVDAVEKHILDHHDTKAWAIRLATEAALTVLRIDQIIMARPAGGPKPPQKEGWDEED